MAGLLEPVEGFDEAQDARACIRGLVARRVLHVKDHVVIEFPIEIGTLDVYLVHLHVEAVGHHDDGVHGCEFGHRCIRVVIVNTANLAETLGDEASLVVNDVAGCILFCLEYPL